MMRSETLTLVWIILKEFVIGEIVRQVESRDSRKHSLLPSTTV